MFVLNPKPTFKHAVTIPTPVGDATLTLEFKHKGRKALDAFIESLKSDDAQRPVYEIIPEIVVGWEGIDTPFSAEALDALLDNYPTASNAIFNAYASALVEGVQKNSKK
jgi:hypothetical protein